MVGVGFRTTAFGRPSEYVAGNASTARSVPSDQARRGLMTSRWLTSYVALAGTLGMINTALANDKPILIGFAIAQTGYQLPFDTGYKTAEIPRLRR